MISRVFLELLIDKTVSQRIKTLLQEKPQRNPYKRFTILAYQLADVGRCIRYAEIYPREREAYLAYLKTAMADLIIQIAILTDLYGFETSDLIKLGSERLDEFRRKGDYEEEEQ